MRRARPRPRALPLPPRALATLSQPRTSTRCSSALQGSCAAWTSARMAPRSASSGRRPPSSAPLAWTVTPSSPPPSSSAATTTAGQVAPLESRGARGRVLTGTDRASEAWARVRRSRLPAHCGPRAEATLWGPWRASLQVETCLASPLSLQTRHSSAVPAVVTATVMWRAAHKARMMTQGLQRLALARPVRQEAHTTSWWAALACRLTMQRPEAWQPMCCGGSRARLRRSPGASSACTRSSANMAAPPHASSPAAALVAPATLGGVLTRMPQWQSSPRSSRSRQERS
mmetsp:Transcript_100696/g.324940  ORF Transcript_100696/g.324940 Transcript_100696/m.324940 type:complete len:287 (+) Transcript_100696:436-1296(+)